MKAVLQNVRTGSIAVEQIAMPAVLPGRVLVRNVCSLVSLGTEKAALEFGRANPIEKGRKRPDLVRRVFQKAASDGIWQTYQSVRDRLDQPVPLGYSSAGIVVSTSTATSGFRTGDRVACAGYGYATHSEYVSVPVNLVTPIPDGVPFEQACFVTIGAIAMQGIRLAQLEIGENVVVYGLGLVGLVTALLAQAAGCRVLGVDLDPQKLQLGQALGIESFSADESLLKLIPQRTRGFGADKALLCAATKSSEPIARIPQLLRQKGVVVVVGDVGMDIPRREYYDREIDIKVSRSYGPGRYDPSYEEGGLDYPYGYVRWTENRNMAAVLELLEGGRVDVSPLITHRFGIDEAKSAYRLIDEPGNELCLGVVLRYCSDHTEAHLPPPIVKLPARRRPGASDSVELGVLGAGNFARSVLLPAFARTKRARFRGVHTASGISALTTAKRYGMDFATADPDALLADPKIRGLIIASRHDSHAELVMRGLQQEKAVFVEKPLAIREEDVDAIRELYQSLESSGRRPFLMVGYNRRFAPLIQEIKRAFARPGMPMTMLYRVNAGTLAPTDWTIDPNVGGGRILGECCHFFDLMMYLCGSQPVRVSAIPLSGGQDSVTITVEYADRSVGTLVYVTDGSRRISKEYLEVHSGGISARLENFRSLKLHGVRAAGRRWYLAAQKGHVQEATAVVDAMAADASAPIPFDDLLAVSRLGFRVMESLNLGQPVLVGASELKAKEAGGPSANGVSASRRFDESDRRGIAC